MSNFGQSKTVSSDGATKGQYLTGDQIQELLGEIDLSDFELVRMDSYSDQAIYETIKKTKKEKELLCSAIQTAVVGMGNKKYGAASLNGEIVDIEKLYKECNVKVKLDLGSVLQPGDLTGRRLQRFFRKQISDYIKKTGVASYLWRKYSDHNEKYKHLVFPGAEHFVESEDELLYLFEVYKALDHRLNIKITERIQRVYNARGYNIVSIDTYGKVIPQAL
jgi:hypothetical protein